MIEIKKKGPNSFLFRIKNLSGVVLLSSVKFTNTEALNRGIENLIMVKKNLIFFERKTNFEGKFLYNLKNKQGSLIGHSQLYSSEAGLENGISNLKKRISSLSKTDLL